MTRPLLRAALVAALLAATYACWVPDLSLLEGKGCDEPHPCLVGVCLANHCVRSPPGTDASTPVLVRRSLLHALEDGGAAVVPETPTDSELLVETAAGGFVALAPSVVDAGLVVFWDAPSGPYLLRLGSRYFASDAGDLDLSEPVVGRPDLTTPSPGTALRTRVHCLSPWDTRDMVTITAAGAGLPGVSLDALPGWVEPANGSGQVLAVSSFAGPLTPGLIQGSRGDQLYFAYLEYTSQVVVLADGGSIQADRWVAQRGFSGEPPLEMVNGAETAYQDTCLNGLDVMNQPGVPAMGSAYVSHLEEISPTSFPTRLSVAVDSAVWPTVPGSRLYQLDWFTPDDLQAVTNFPGKDLYPASWPQRVTMTMEAIVPVVLQLPEDAGALLAFEVGSLSSTRAYPTNASLEPAVSPPVAVRVNGAPAQNGVTGAGVRPVISWDPPQLGTPSAYEVAIWRQQDPSRQKALRLEGTLWTGDTQVRLPTGLLVQGATYVIHVRAVSAPLDVHRAPLQAGLPYDDAVTITGLIEP